MTQKLWHVPPLVVPGKVAFTDPRRALEYAHHIGSHVLEPIPEEVIVEMNAEAFQKAAGSNNVVNTIELDVKSQQG